jgi:EpsI family protein
MTPRAGAMFFLLTAGAFSSTIPGYLELWRAQPYTHGYLVALAAVWLVWRERRALQVPGRILPGALWLTAGLSFLWLISTVMSVGTVVLTTVPLVLLAWVAAVFGAQAARSVAPAAVTFLLAVPIWDRLAQPMQAMTVFVNSVVVGLLDIPAVIEGDMVYVEFGSFHIADGCAGLNYLMSGLTVAALHAQLFRMRWRASVAVMGVAALIAIVGNWVRVSSLIGMGYSSGMQSIFVTNSAAHLLYGWGIFALGLFLYFPLAGRAQRWADRRWPNARGEGATIRAEGAEPAAFESPLRRAGLATSAAVAGPLVLLVGGAIAARAPDPVRITPAGSQWVARQALGARPYDWRPMFLGAEQELHELWTDGRDTVLVDRFVYRRQVQGAELVGYFNRIAADTALVAERLLGPVGPRRRLVNEAIVREGEGYVLVWYWYRVGGAETESAARAKVLELWAFARLSMVSELIALSTPCDGDSCAEASGALSAFLADG